MKKNLLDILINPVHLVEVSLITLVTRLKEQHRK